MMSITREELKAKIDAGAPFYLFEVLAAQYYRHSHLPGARHMPPEGVIETAMREVPDKEAEIVVYCASPDWHASENAARELAAMGYENVREYAGGKEDWAAAGLPLERYQRPPKN